MPLSKFGISISPFIVLLLLCYIVCCNRKSFGCTWNKSFANSAFHLLINIDVRIPYHVF